MPMPDPREAAPQTGGHVEPVKTARFAEAAGEGGAIVIVSPNWLGDAVMALPAIADVKRHYPSSRLVVAARPAVAGLFAMAPYVDDVITLAWRGRLLDRRRLAADASALRNVQASVGILLPNSFASAWLLRHASIAERWGYASDLRTPLLSRAVRRPKESLHQGAYYQHLVRELGVESGPLRPQLVIPEVAIDAARARLVQRGWDGRRPLLAVAPGAAYGTAKRWPPDSFAALVTTLVREHRMHTVLLGGAADRETTARVYRAVGEDQRPFVTDLAGETTLESLGATCRLAAVCASNDSGAMHVAAAAGVPLAAIFGPTREHETSPLVAASGRVDVVINPVWCRPCMLRECPIDHRCMAGLEPASVAGRVRALMEVQ
jgi:heptosyltransferase-2